MSEKISANTPYMPDLFRDYLEFEGVPEFSITDMLTYINNSKPKIATLGAAIVFCIGRWNRPFDKFVEWIDTINSLRDVSAPAATHDPVKHPSHYTSHPSGVECITIIEHMPYNIGAAMKYLWRAGLKEGAPPLQDLEKSREYVDFEIARLKRGA